MTDLIRFLFILVLSALTLCAYLVVWRILCPQRVAFVIQQAEATPMRATVIGFINLLFFGIVTLGLLILSDQMKSSPFAVLFLLAGVGLAIALTIGLSMGLAAMVQLVGLRLQPHATPVRQSIAGSCGLVLACSTPFVGWFLLFPYIAALGTGAFILHALGRINQPKQTQSSA